MIDRRTFLAGSAGLAAAGALSSVGGCGLPGLGDTVTVAVTWSGDELNAFRSVLDRLDLDYRVDPIPLGDDIGTAFTQPASRRPDVIMLPRPGLVAIHRDELKPLPEQVIGPTWPYAEVWKDLLYLDERLYGLPFKVTHKSVVWYRTSLFDRHGLAPPRTWHEWLWLNETLVSRGITPLALAGADGWMLTDLFENVLAGCEPGAYTRLADSENPRLSSEAAVGTALRLLGRMWAPRGTLAGGAVGSLVRQYSDAIVEVFGYGRAAMVVVPDFAEPIIRRYAPDLEDAGVFLFPEVDGDDDTPVPDSASNPLVVGGDVAVLSRRASEHADDLVIRLAEPSTQRPWIARGGFLSPDARTLEERYSPALRTLAKDIRDRAEVIRFDLSDQLGALGGSGGLWRVLQDFLARVGDSDDVDGVEDGVHDALRRLHELEG